MTPKRLPKDLIAGILFLAIGVMVLVAIPSQVRDMRDEFEVGPRYVPTMMGIIIVGLSGLLIAKTAVTVKMKTAEWVSIRSVVPTKEAIAVIGLIVIWIAALGIADYLLVSSIVVVLGLLLFRVKKVVHHLIAVSFVIAVWASFTFILNVRLP
jgi:hypothetical protein